MSYSVKERVAECYRRAEEYKKLYHRASNLDEREIYLSTVRQFLRVAKDLEPQAGSSTLAREIEGRQPEQGS
jgi:hypothetical protein